MSGDPSEETEIAKMKKMLEVFDETKTLYDDAVKADITIKWDGDPDAYIQQRIRNLFDLQLNGPTIKRIFETRVAGDDFTIDDYIHTAIFRKKDKTETKKNRTKKNNKENSAKKNEMTEKTGGSEQKKGENKSKKKNDNKNGEKDKSKSGAAQVTEEKAIVGENKEQKGPAVQQSKGKKGDNNKPNDKAPKNTPPKKKNVNDNKAKKELESFTAEELRQMLDEKLKLDKAQKKINRQPPKPQNVKTKTGDVAGSSSQRSRTPPPPYGAVSGKAPTYPHQGHQNYPPNHTPSHYGGPYPPPLMPPTGYPPYHHPGYNHQPGKFYSVIGLGPTS